MSTVSEKLLKNPLREDEQLYFIHVPKCAGTSFFNAVDEHFVLDEICPVHNNIHQFKNYLSDKQLQNYKFIRGHLPYDLVVPRLQQTPRILTFLREPVVRFISNIEMRQRVHDEHVGLYPRMKHMTLEQVLADHELVKVFANRATRLIGGITHQKKTGSPIPNLERAKERLAAFDFVGIVEYFQESLEQFAYIYDFPAIPSQHEMNISPNREKRQKIHPSILERVAEIEYADLELYQLGLQLFEQQRKRIADEKAFDAGKITFKRVERLHLNFSRVNPGSGWHVARQRFPFGLVRWSGNSNISNLYLPLQTEKDLQIQFRVVFSLDRSLLNSLSFFVNGEAIALQHRADGFLGETLFFGVIPAAVLRRADREVILTFQLEKTLPLPKLFLWKKDARRFGLCYQWLDLQPVQ